MKSILLIVLIVITLLRCKAPLPVTGNPDKLTSTSGTAGSSKMSDELPGNPGTAGVKTDTTKLGRPIVIDSSRRKNDSIPH
jgi:hypothetical protein